MLSRSGISTSTAIALSADTAGGAKPKESPKSGLMETLQVGLYFAFWYIFNIAGLNTIEDHFFVFQDRLSNFEAQLDLSGFRREDISRIDPQELRLTAIFAGEEYDFIREVSLDLFVN